MRLSNIELTNFRGFGPKTQISLSDCTVLVGANNAGKSSVLKAIDIFFRSTPKRSDLRKDDFHTAVGPVQASHIEIALSFESLSAAEVETFGHYARSGRLKFILRATKGPDESINSKILGVRTGNPAFKEFFQKGTAKDKKAEYNLFREKYDLPEFETEEIATEAIWRFEANNPEENIEIESNENAYGATGPIPKLKQHLDWIYVPAVKEAIEESREEKKSQFSALIERVIRSQLSIDSKLAEIAKEAEARVIAEVTAAEKQKDRLETALRKAFSDLSPSDVQVSLEWDSSQSVAAQFPLLETKFLRNSNATTLEFFGHGTQRSYLMALLPLVAGYEQESEGEKKTLILAIEEPELYQHPPQAKYIASALEHLSKTGSQVLVTTHSPYFVDARNFDGTRKLKDHPVSSFSVDRHRNYCATVMGVEPHTITAATSKLDSFLNPRISELFFCDKAVIVEGQEDIAIIRSFLQKTGRWIEFIRRGCEFIDSNGKPSIPTVLSICRGFEIENYTIFDMDLKIEDGIYKENKNSSNENMAKFISVFDRAVAEDQITDTFTAWKTNIQDSISMIEPRWNEIREEISAEWGGGGKKNPMIIEATVARALEEGLTLQPLRDCVEKIENFWGQ